MCRPTIALRAPWRASRSAACLSGASAALAGETIGPGGEAATPSSALTLSDSEVAKIKEGKYTAALLWHTSSDFVNAVTAGAQQTNSTGSEFRSSRRRTPASTRPSRRATSKRFSPRSRARSSRLPLDPVTSAEAFKPAVADGVKIVLLSNKPKDFVQGKDYVDDRHRRSLPDGQARRGRPGHGDRQEGKNRVDLSRRAVLCDEPARQRLQGNDRVRLSRYFDRREAGHRRPRAGARHRAGAASEEPRPRRRSTSLGPSPRKACSRRCAPQETSTRRS